MRRHWISYQTTPMNVQNPSTRMVLDQSSPVSGNETQNGGGGIAQAKRLQSDLEAMGNKIKQHNDNLKYLQAQKNKLDEAIIDFCFAKPAAPRTMDNYCETEKKMKELECKKDKTMEDIKREQVLRDHALFNFVRKREEFALFLAQSSITDQVAKLALMESI